MIDRIESANYTDFKSLQALKTPGHENDPRTIAQVAKQFESMYIGLMLQSMREATRSLNPDDELNSQESEFYQDMFDKQMSVNLSSHGGIGLADVIARQMTQHQTSTPDTDVNAVSSTSGNHLPPPGTVTTAPASPVMTNTPPVKVDTPAQKPSSLGPVSQAAPIFDGSPQAFISAMLPHARAAAAGLGISPRVIIAQAALETGWGKSVKTGQLNLFGIKADGAWQGDSIRQPTLECKDGVLQKEHANFRAYSSIAASVHDYVNFLKSNPRYQQAIKAGNNEKAFVHHLSSAGYATDPHYANKLARILNSSSLAAIGSSSG